MRLLNHSVLWDPNSYASQDTTAAIAMRCGGPLLLSVSFPCVLLCYCHHTAYLILHRSGSPSHDRNDPHERPKTLFFLMFRHGVCSIFMSCSYDGSSTHHGRCENGVGSSGKVLSRHMGACALRMVHVGLKGIGRRSYPSLSMLSLTGPSSTHICQDGLGGLHIAYHGCMSNGSWPRIS